MKNIKISNAFTLVELLVAVALIGILSSISLILYTTWQSDTYTSSVKSDAMNVASAMESARNFSTSGYPTFASSVFSSSPDITMSGGSSDGGKTYCVDLRSSKKTTIQYYIDSTTSRSGAQVGTCAGRSSTLAAPSSITATTGSTSSISITFSTVSGATGYNIQRATNSSFTDAVTIATLGSSPSLPYTSSSLDENTKYYYRVQTIRSNINSVWSSVASAQTSTSVLAAPSAPTITKSATTTTTTFSWNSVSCSAGSSALYQYMYALDSPTGYTSAWKNISQFSAVFSTPIQDNDYTISLRVRCVNSENTSNWSTVASSTYYRRIASTQFTGDCFIASTGFPYCWGQGNVSQLGNGGNTYQASPVAVQTGALGGQTVSAITDGGAHRCVIGTNDGYAYCWGYNLYGRLGDSSTTTRGAPVLVSRSGVLNGLTIKQISAGNATTCVIASDNNAYCWGLNDQGQLGDGTIVNKSYPVAVTRTGVLNGLTIKQISVAGANVCVIASDNYPYCWGQNDYALGVGSTPSYSSVPMAVTRTGVLAGLTVKKISTGGRNTCVIASDNNGYCWGQNMYGENGNGTSTVNTAPVAVTRTGVLNGLTLKDISTGITTCAIASDNNAYCWGQNATNSNLGNNSTVNSNVPVTVYRTGALNGLTSVSLGRGMAMCMVASNAKIYCWGISDYSMVPGALAGMTSLTVRTE